MTDPEQETPFSEIERGIRVSFHLMRDYRELDEPEVAAFHERKMNEGLDKWSDLKKYLAQTAVKALTNEQAA